MRATVGKTTVELVFVGPRSQSQPAVGSNIQKQPWSTLLKKSSIISMFTLHEDRVFPAPSKLFEGELRVRSGAMGFLLHQTLLITYNRIAYNRSIFLFDTVAAIRI